MPEFIHRDGRYPVKCGTLPVERFICKECEKGFSGRRFEPTTGNGSLTSMPPSFI
jgi:hypothetical protein